MERKNNSWGSDSFTLSVEHLSRQQLREIQLDLEAHGWKTHAGKSSVPVRGSIVNTLKLYKFLFDGSLPSISPQVSMNLFSIQQSVAKALPNIKDPEVKSVLSDYNEALKLVCDMAVIHQRASIDKLSALVGATK